LSDEEIIGKISDFLDENDNLVKLIIKEHIWDLQGKTWVCWDDLVQLKAISLCTLWFLYYVQWDLVPKAEKLVEQIFEIRWLIKWILKKRG
jgi:hypothetical protein